MLGELCLEEVCESALEAIDLSRRESRWGFAFGRGLKDLILLLVGHWLRLVLLFLYIIFFEPFVEALAHILLHALGVGTRGGAGECCFNLGSHGLWQLGN